MFRPGGKRVAGSYIDRGTFSPETAEGGGETAIP
jgi:hypothetical protein